MSRGHILALPFPAEGHVNPMMHLCVFLARQGFSITFAAMSFSPFDAFRLIRSKAAWPPPGLKISLRQLNPPEDASFPAEAYSENRADMIKVLMHARRYSASLEELVRDIPEEVRCIISDYVLDWAPDVAVKLGSVPAILVATSASCIWFELNVAALSAAGLVPTQPAGTELRDEEDCIVLDKPSKLRRSEIPWHFWGNRAYQDHRAKHNIAMLRKVPLTLINTCAHLEGEFLDAINGEIDGELLPVGPLFLLNPDRAPDVGFGVAESRECLEWLDQQPPSSVVYISFGSFAALPVNQAEEVVRGIQASEQRFLWVVRDSSQILHRNLLPAKKSKDHLVVSWSPQTQVLAHPSIGAFLSHCGWNSSLEAVASGKPILCWPLLFEQNTNCSLIVEKWKIGIRFATSNGDGGLVARDEVERAVRLVMELDDGRKMRQRAQSLSQMIRAHVPAAGLVEFTKYCKTE